MLDSSPDRFGPVDPAAFLADLEAKPAALLDLLDHLPGWDGVATGPLVLTGMGSSRPRSPSCSTDVTAGYRR